ncbi:MAG: CorA family divalent cation transporter [Isosphaeraceae bacterium]
MKALVFDFTTRIEQETAPIAACAYYQADGEGPYVWFDLDTGRDPDGARGVLRRVGLDGERLEAALDTSKMPEQRLYQDGIHTFVIAPVVDRGDLRLAGVAFLLGTGYCATVRSGPVEFVEEAWQSCPGDFRNFAKTPGFLIYEFWDHLIASYRECAESLGDRVRQAQSAAFDETGDAIFGRVAALSRELLMLRRAMVASRETLDTLVTRRSALVPKSTKPYLRALVGSLDRLVADLAVEREILSETLNLYIGMVGHRTNQVVNRLTVISFVFLPLTFFCSVYGMNFFIPETQLRYGYPVFWILSLTFITTALSVMRRRGWV